MNGKRNNWSILGDLGGLMKRITIALFMTFSLFLSSCQANAPIPNTPIPLTLTRTQTITPTTTLAPTATITPFNTPPPTLSPTPGRLCIYDDFSKKTDIWGPCPGCVWKGGKLFMGPYKYNDVPQNLYRMVCEACGKPKYFRLSVRVEFVEGGGLDRGFGLLVLDNEDRLLDLEITTGQVGYFWEFDFGGQSWRPLNTWKQAIAGRLFPGYESNNLEVIAKPGQNDALVDYEIYMNKSKPFVIWTEPLKPGFVGLVVGFHSVGVAFDDFEFEELPADKPCQEKSKPSGSSVWGIK
jgi:hypothetical protein